MRCMSSNPSLELHLLLLPSFRRFWITVLTDALPLMHVPDKVLYTHAVLSCVVCGRVFLQMEGL